MLRSRAKPGSAQVRTAPGFAFSGEQA